MLKTNQEIITTGKSITFRNKAVQSLGGFVQLPRAVLRIKGITLGAKLVYGLLYSYTWTDGQDYPQNSMDVAQTKIAKDTGISLRSIKDYVKELKEKKFISIIRKGLNLPNIYIIEDLQSGSADSAPQEVQGLHTNKNNNTPITNRYRFVFSNKDVGDVVSFFDNLFPEKKKTLRFKDARNYLAKAGKDQLIANIEALKFNAKTNPAGYLRIVIEKGTGKVKVSKKESVKKLEEEKRIKDKQWMKEVKESREKFAKLIEIFQNLPKETQDEIRLKVEKTIDKSVPFGRGKLIELGIAGIIEKEYQK